MMILWLSCTSAPPEVRWFGALRAIVHEGQTEAQVQLPSAVSAHSWAVGALGGLRGEITVRDGEVWLGLPRDGQVEVIRGPVPDEGATLLVIAEVPAWEELPIERDVPYTSLDAFLAEQLRQRGFSPDAPVPIRISGPVPEVRWHVVDGWHADHSRHALNGVLLDQEVELVGFFSTRHQGVFTHQGASSHFHVIVEQPALTGHVDEVRLGAGARLWLPRR
jgi:hypothetical protein